MEYLILIILKICNPIYRYISTFFMLLMFNGKGSKDNFMKVKEVLALCEEKVVRSPFYIYKNPTPDEVFACGHINRFILDNDNKSIYVWNASESNHVEAIEKLFGANNVYHIYYNPNYLCGGGDPTSTGKIKLYGCDNIENQSNGKKATVDLLAGMMKKDWSFAGKYFTTSIKDYLITANRNIKKEDMKK
jgi:hypothetical protein